MFIESYSQDVFCETLMTLQQEVKNGLDLNQMNSCWRKFEVYGVNFQLQVHAPAICPSFFNGRGGAYISKSELCMSCIHFSLWNWTCVCETWMLLTTTKSKCGKIYKSHIMTAPQGAGDVSEVWATLRWTYTILTVQVWLLYHHSNLNYCTFYVSGMELRTKCQMDGRSHY